MNVKIEHEIHIKVDKDVETLLKSRSDLAEDAMKRVALILLALGIVSLQAATHTLNDAGARGRVEALSGLSGRFNRMRNAGAGQSHQRGAHEKATRSWLTAIICPV